MPVDLFFHRDIEELKKNEEEQANNAKMDEAPVNAGAAVYDDVIPDMAGGDMYGGQPVVAASGTEWDAAGDAGGAVATEQW